MKIAAIVLAILPAIVSAQGTDYSKVEIKTTKIAGNFYTLEAQGPEPWAAPWAC